MHGPVVVVIGGRCEEHADLGRVDLAVGDELLPNRNVQRPGLHLAGGHSGDGGVVRAAEGYALEVLLRVEPRLQQEAAWHQMTGCAAGRTETHILAFQVGQGLDRRIGGDENRAEARVFFTLHQWDHLATRAHVGLHEGESAEPGEVDFAIDQRLDRGRVVGHGRVFHLHAQLALQVLDQRRCLARQLSGRFVGDGGDAEHLLRVGDATEGQHGAGQQRTQGSRKRQIDHVVVSPGRSEVEVRGL